MITTTNAITAKRRSFYAETGKSRFFPGQACRVKNPGEPAYDGCLVAPLVIGNQSLLKVGRHPAYNRATTTASPVKYFGIEQNILFEKEGKGPAYFFDDHRFWFYALVESIASGLIVEPPIAIQTEFYTPDHLDYARPETDFKEKAIFSPNNDQGKLLQAAFDYSAHELSDITHNVAAQQAGLVTDIFHLPVNPGRFFLTKSLYAKEIKQREQRRQQLNIPPLPATLQKLTDLNSQPCLFASKVNQGSICEETFALFELLRGERPSVLIIDLDAFLTLSQDLLYRRQLDNREAYQIPLTERRVLDRMAELLVKYMNWATVSVVITSPGFAPQDSCVYLAQRICELY